MSSMTPTEACINIANSFEEFLHHKRDYQDILDNLQECLDVISINAYSIGFFDAKNGKTENPMQVTDPYWQNRFRGI